MSESQKQFATSHADALELAAQICEARAVAWDRAVREGSEQRGYEETVLMECAAAMRALKASAPSETPFSEAERLSKKWLAAHPHAMMVVEHAGAMLRDALQPTASAVSAIRRSMDDAPKDGAPILGWVPTYHRGKGAWVVVLWLEAKGMREAGWMDNQAFLTKPTCWLPLPEAP